ncbi:MAG: type VI secretion system ATPase TssH, partial [Pseudomonadales bacterium]|nr:type VI secretion system ATPase TssH [Pseudomonadales bacterium]
MRIDKFTTQLQKALSDAQSLAVGRDHNFIEPTHLMLAMLDQQGGSIKPLLMQAGCNVVQLNESLKNVLNRMAKIQGHQGDVNMSNELVRLLNVTDKLAQQRSDQYISSELVLLAAFEVKGELQRLLQQAGANQSQVEQVIERVRGGEKVNDPNAEENRQALDRYTIDLTAKAEKGELDPVIGRDEEIRRTIQVLQRRTKNNPVLIGEPGVGKTAIV